MHFFITFSLKFWKISPPLPPPPHIPAINIWKDFPTPVLFQTPHLLIFGKFSNPLPPPTIPSPRLLATKDYFFGDKKIAFKNPFDLYFHPLTIEFFWFAQPGHILERQGMRAI